MKLPRINSETMKLMPAVRTGVATDEEKAHFFSMVRDICMKPAVDFARRKSGLAKFEREQRRCVYPDGPMPILAWKVEGEPEYDDRQKLVAKMDTMVQELRLQICGH